MASSVKVKPIAVDLHLWSNTPFVFDINSTFNFVKDICLQSIVGPRHLTIFPNL